MRRCKDWDHEISSWKYLAIQRPVTPVFLEHRMSHSLPWTPFRACLRSTAAAAQDSISTENSISTWNSTSKDGKCHVKHPFVVDKKKKTVLIVKLNSVEGFPGGTSEMFNPWVWMIPWRRARQPTPVFLPGEFHGQRNLASCSDFWQAALT